MVNKPELNKQNGRRGVKADNEKLIELRTKNALTQEALAGKSKLAVRTIQRAEAGGIIGLQTLQEIASALGVQHAELFAEDKSSEQVDDDYDGETIAIALRPQSSARALLDIVCECRDCRLGHTVDFTGEMVEVIKKFCDAIRPISPELCPGYPEFPTYPPEQRNEFARFAERITIEAEINDAMDRLRGSGFDIYAGAYFDYQKVPYYDIDEFAWVTRKNQREEAVKIAVIRIAQAGERQISVRVKCNAVPF